MPGDNKVRNDMASRLRHRVDLQARVLASSGGGGFSESWNTVATLWAAIEPRSGDEAVFAERLEGPCRFRITLRYRDGVTPDMRVRFGTRIFNIRQVACPDEKREMLVLTTEERIAV